MVDRPDIPNEPSDLRQREVSRLVPDKDTEAVQDIEELRVRRVVAHPPRVPAHLGHEGCRVHYSGLSIHNRTRERGLQKHDCTARGCAHRPQHLHAK